MFLFIYGTYAIVSIRPNIRLLKTARRRVTPYLYTFVSIFKVLKVK